MENITWFQGARFGLFIHYGLYSLLGRGEWVMNREGFSPQEYARLAKSFTADHFNADDIICRAKTWGMKYAVFTAKHHDGFCLYDSALTEFTSMKTPAKRDLTAEFVNACRKHGLKIGIYFSLNDWSISPDAVDAIENPDRYYQPFIDYVHAQVHELTHNYGNIDILWYDGWWPFDGKGWQAEKMNVMVKKIHPNILVNSRNGAQGDSITPEGHIPYPGYQKPWEACATLNKHWGYHVGDNDWKTPKEVIEMLAKCSAGGGNLLLNIGPKADGSIPGKAIQIMDKVGSWLQMNGEAIFDTNRFDFLPDRIIRSKI